MVHHKHRTQDKECKNQSPAKVHLLECKYILNKEQYVHHVLIVDTVIKNCNSMKTDVITTLLPTLVVKAHQEQ